MNKIILTVVILAGVLCLTDATCDLGALATCQSAAQSAAVAAGTDKTKICPIINTFESCIGKAGCPVSQIKTVIDAMEKAAGITCGTSMAKVSIAAMLLALVASYLSK